MRRNMKAEYISWGARYHWRWLGVMTFRRRLPADRAWGLLKRWIRNIELIEGRQLSWLAVPERGEKGRLHFHILIGGIRSRLMRHTSTWNSMAGHCHLVLFDPNHGRRTGDPDPSNRGVAYAMKSLASDDYDIDGQLQPHHLLPRFKDGETAPASIGPDAKQGTCGYKNRHTGAND